VTHIPSTTRRAPNHLAGEKSPYLLQHLHNPVDWYPWGAEAFDKARREGRPIFLSIGYSTCHWCHVMEHESFEDEAVAALLNERFVPIKVDREERPDVDRVYMTAMQALRMGGGWPLNVFLTPELQPFYGGTYFPPRTLPGRIGLVDVLARVSDAWRERRDAMARQGAVVLDAIGDWLDQSAAAATLAATERGRLADRCFEMLSQVEDREHGGFGEAPKFPQVSFLTFLFRRYARDPAHDERPRDMALRQLDAMRASGIHDQVGGGFHRYSTDREWLVPHFEKMLYDQAQLAWAYLDAFQLTGRDEYAATARGIFEYVARDLDAPEGGFYSAEDADSEGEEGRFYVWTPEQLAEALPADLAALAAYRWGVTERGNFEHGATILHEAHSIEDAASHAGLTVEAARAALETARRSVLAARERRPRPHRDDKVLAAWNGLMISAFARGARVLGDDALRERAVRAATFAWEQLWEPASSMLRRRWRDGEAGIAGQLDDYAYLALGFLDVYRATLEPTWLERAIQLTEAQNTRFWDEGRGGFFESPADDPELPLRMKNDHDGAELSGNSIAAANLLVLGALLDRADLRERAERTLALFAARLEESPVAMPLMLVAMASAATAPRHVVVAGRAGAADTLALAREFDRRYLPDDVLLLADPDDRSRALARLAPFTASLAPIAGAATAYVCVDYACTLPTTRADEFAARLDSVPGER